MTTTTRLELLKPHRHAGRNYPAGGHISLPERKAAWLVGLGVAREAPAPASQSAAPASAPTLKRTTTKE